MVTDWKLLVENRDYSIGFIIFQASKKQKLFLMSWCPDTAKVKKKMLYSSSFDALKKSLVGVQKYIQATDLSEASEEAVEEKLRATDRN